MIHFLVLYSTRILVQLAVLHACKVDRRGPPDLARAQTYHLVADLPHSRGRPSHVSASAWKELRASDSIDFLTFTCLELHALRRVSSAKGILADVKLKARRRTLAT